LKDQWLGSNVDLSLLSQRIEQFFKEREFDTVTEKFDADFTIRASAFQLKTKVRIFGRPNDFTIEFIPASKTRGFSLGMIVGYITSVFGGGGLVLRDLKTQENLDRFEDTFWEYVDLQVGELKNSVKGS